MIKIKNFITYLKTLNFSFFLGVFIILFTIWNKSLRIRVPKTIHDFDTFYMIFIVYINIVILTLIIVFCIWTLVSSNINKDKGYILEYIVSYKFINNILSWIYKTSESISQAPKKVYRLFFDNVNISHILEIPFYKISHYIKELPIRFAYILTVIHVIFYTLPKTIPAIIFMFEIILFGHINYFYKSLFLYVIVLIYNVLLWVLGDLADNNIYFATAHIKVKDTPEEFTAKFREEIPPITGAVDIISRRSDERLLRWFVYIYETYLDIKWLVYRLYLEKNKFKYYERILISTLFLIGWIYILYVCRLCYM